MAEVEYKEPSGKYIEWGTANGRRDPKVESENDVLRVKWFEADPAIAALKKIDSSVSRTAGWGRSDFLIAVQTDKGTMFLNPGDKLTKNKVKGKDRVRVIRAGDEE